MPLSNFPHPSLNHFRIMAAQVCVFFEPLPITSQKMREVLFEEWEEDLLGARLQEQWGSAEEGRSVSGGGFADAVQALLRSEEHTSELQSLRHLVCRLL